MTTIISAQYANPNSTAVIATTEKDGGVIIAEDRPGLWAELQAWVAAGGTIAPFPREAELTAIAQKRRDEVNALQAAKFELGLALPNGKRVQLRQEDQGNISAMVARANLAVQEFASWPGNFRWRLADNSYGDPMTPAQMIALGNDCSNRVLQIRMEAWARKDAITAIENDASKSEAQRIADIARLNVSVGW